MSLPRPDPSTVALITGASSGLGEEFARELSDLGHNLAIVARRRERLESLAEELRAASRIEVLVYERDLGVEEERAALIADVRSSGKAVVGLVNNAGFGSSGRFWKLEQEREREEVRVNVVALHHLTGELVPEMVERGAGAILNVASIAAFQPIPAMATYAATKAFVQSFSESLHSDLAGTGVSCTVLCPGPMATEWEEIADVGGGWMPGVTYVSPANVVKAAIEGMKRGKRSVIPGRVPQALAAGGRFIPRSAYLPIARVVSARRRGRS